MAVDIVHFTPGSALAGGALIGLSSALFYRWRGRVAGVSGLLGNLLEGEAGAVGSALFLAGLLSAPLLCRGLPAAPLPAAPTTPGGWAQVIAAGWLVGFGTRLANGCTSGHGVCGLASASPRSLAAVLVFIAGGALSVFVLRHVAGGGY